MIALNRAGRRFAPVVAAVAGRRFQRVRSAPWALARRRVPAAAPMWRRAAFASDSGNAVTVEVPAMGDSITEGTVSSWIKSEGDYVEADEVVAVLETDKVSIDVRSPVAGTVAKRLAEEGDEVAVGAPIFEVIEGEGEKPTQPQTDASESAAAPSEAAQQTAQQPSAPAPSPAPAPAAPSSAAPSSTAKTSSSSASSSASKPVEFGSSAPSRGEHRVPMSRMRRKIAERLKEAQNTAASLTTFNEIDMSNLMAMRSQYKESFAETHDVKLGFMSAFVKASVAALQQEPSVNAFIDGNDIVYHDYCDISVAVATPNGLVVPVLRNCETMSFAGIERSIANLSRRARDGQLSLEDMAGGTFTISNGGVYGSLFGTPILNPPQSAILGMHGIFERPVAISGQVQIRPMMYVALTYDHRIIDGREAVTFLRKVKDSVEQPQRLLLGL